MSEHFIIAGIAAEDQAILRKDLLGKGSRQTNTIIFLTVGKKNPTYKKKVIESMIAGLARTVSKKSPDKIRVIYMPYKNSDILKDLFFPFADTQSFDDSETYYEYALKYVKNIHELGDKLLKIIRNGLKIKGRPPKKHCLLLPNKNFVVKNNDFSELLYKFYFGNLDENLFKNIKKNNDLRCCEDSRDLAFPASKTSEGSLRFKQSTMTPHHFLSGIYRFGLSWGAGFHFDVTHVRKPTLSGCKFTCSIHGEVENKRATHVNIYLNDFIRIP